VLPEGGRPWEGGPRAVAMREMRSLLLALAATVSRWEEGGPSPAPIEGVLPCLQRPAGFGIPGSAPSFELAGVGAAGLPPAVEHAGPAG